ncbi:type II toxin-antitoxin system Phd/YefM family antitoxin [Companilactobacillus sp. FL22-1]|uniref:type II toxin-antitoxin system Phd/YefM family antitoxin n=1 Tax=Companilactobacillus sp. FL22-1 TaxID=3373892 RepID=UPI0037540F76
MQRTVNPTQARKDFYKIIKSVNEDSTPIEINGRSEEDSAVIMSSKDYRALQETLYLMHDGNRLIKYIKPLKMIQEALILLMVLIGIKSNAKISGEIS